MKTTKKILFGFVVILTLLLFFQACEKNSNVDFSGKYTVQLGETIKIPRNSKLATLTFQEITDSRCPVDVNCIWEGAAQAKFKLKTAQNQQLVELCLGVCEVISKRKFQEFTLGNTTYIIKLIEVNPYPGSKNENQNPMATILVEKK